MPMHVQIKARSKIYIYIFSCDNAVRLAFYMLKRVDDGAQSANIHVRVETCWIPSGQVAEHSWFDKVE